MTSDLTPDRRRFLVDATLAGMTATGLAGLPFRVGTAGDYLFGRNVVYLNTAALGPTPRAVVEKATAAWYDLEADPSNNGYGRLQAAMEGVRARAAAFLGCGLDEMIVTHSTTQGMNAIAQGLSLSSGQRILTNDQEHLGGQNGWKHYARRFGVVIDTIPLSPDDHDTQRIVERFAAAITPATRVISLSHVLTSSGLRMPIPEISALARSRGCVCVVDGAQAVGAIAVNVKALGCHAYATSGHKWLMGPPGTGLLYLSAETAKVIDPIFVEDGRTVYSESTGVRNIPGVLGLGIAIDAMTTIGMRAVETRAVGLRNRLYAALQTLPKVSVVSPPPGPLATPIVTFRLADSVNSKDLVARLRDRYHIDIKDARIMMPQNSLNGIRASTHIFNSQHDLDHLTHALRLELA